MAWEKFTGKGKHFKNAMKREVAQEWEKVNPNDCTHVGFYVPVGMEVFKIGVAEDLYEVIIGKLCLRCGKEFTSKTSMLSLKYVEKIKTPKIPITPPPEIREPIENTPLAQVIKRAYIPRKKKEDKSKVVAHRVDGKERRYFKRKKMIPRYP